MSRTKRKNYRLTEECLQVLRRTQEQQQFKTETETLHYIIMEHERQKEEGTAWLEKESAQRIITEEMNQKLSPVFRRIYSTVSETERQTYMILDAINTMLYDGKATFLMEADGQTKHRILMDSERNYL